MSKDREIKMKLLQTLMEEMDDSIMSSFKKKPTVHVKEVEEKEMPVDEAEDLIKEKMGMSPEVDADDDEEDEIDSRLLSRIKELRNKKKSL